MNRLSQALRLTPSPYRDVRECTHQRARRSNHPNDWTCGQPSTYDAGGVQLRHAVLRGVMLGGDYDEMP